MKKTAIFIIMCIFATICGAQSVRPMVENINVTTPGQTDIVTITWTFKENSLSQIKELLVYKKTETIIKSSDISMLAPIASLLPTQAYFSDTITDFSSYYYAVVARKNDGQLYDVIIPTVNATNIAIFKEKSQNVIAPTEENAYANASSQIDSTIKAPLRERPLPSLLIIQDSTSSEHPLVSEAALGTADSLAYSIENEMFLTPYILDEDKNGSTATGDDYTLFLIVRSLIAQENWATSQEELLRFLQVNRTAATTIRANFYLAQCYYFQHNYRQALSHFQKTEKLYPVQSKKWIEESLNKFTIN